MLQEINKKVLSYCVIPKELSQDAWFSDYMNGCYVNYSLGTESELDDWIAKTYPELIGIEFLIEIDY